MTETPKPTGKLESDALKLRKQLLRIEEAFKDDKHSPVLNKEFDRFIKGEACLIAARYIMGAEDREPGDSLDEAAEARRAAGWIVGEGKSPEEVPEHPDKHFLETPVVQLARSMGFDPSRAYDDEDDLAPKPKTEPKAPNDNPTRSDKLS